VSRIALELAAAQVSRIDRRAQAKPDRKRQVLPPDPVEPQTGRKPIRNGLVRREWVVAVVLALMAFAACADAADEKPVEGQYLQNRRCKGDRSDPAGLKVTIAANEITYAGGVCSIDSRRNEASRIIYAVTCKFRSGAVMGAEIAFTPLDGGVLHMVQQDGTFEADLFKCPK
jgi:hypothetical protein